MPCQRLPEQPVQNRYKTSRPDTALQLLEILSSSWKKPLRIVFSNAFFTNTLPLFTSYDGLYCAPTRLNVFRFASVQLAWDLSNLLISGTVKLALNNMCHIRHTPIRFTVSAPKVRTCETKEPSY